MGSPVKFEKLRRGLHPRHVYVVAVTAVVEIGLRATKLPRLTRFLRIRLGIDDGPEISGKPVSNILPDPAVDMRIRQCARAVDRVIRRWPFGDTCLRRALILGFIIRRLEPALLIGVRRDEAGEIAAHAWLVVDDVSLDPLATHYLSLRNGTRS